MDEVAVDPRLRTAINWTSLTSDADLLASILTTWTTLEHSYYHYVDRDAFLDDMANGREDFCSALLVNALLATACVCALVTLSHRADFDHLIHILILGSRQTLKSGTGRYHSRSLLS